MAFENSDITNDFQAKFSGKSYLLDYYKKVSTGDEDISRTSIEWLQKELQNTGELITCY